MWLRIFLETAKTNPKLYTFGSRPGLHCCTMQCATRMCGGWSSSTIIKEAHPNSSRQQLHRKAPAGWPNPPFQEGTRNLKNCSKQQQVVPQARQTSPNSQNPTRARFQCRYPNGDPASDLALAIPRHEKRKTNMTNPRKRKLPAFPSRAVRNSMTPTSDIPRWHHGRASSTRPAPPDCTDAIVSLPRKEKESMYPARTEEKAGGGPRILKREGKREGSQRWYSIIIVCGAGGVRAGESLTPREGGVVVGCCSVRRKVKYRGMEGGSKK